MAATRTGGRARPSRAASTRNPPQPSRPSLARQSKPTKSLYVDDSSDDSHDADDSDSSAHSVHDAADDADTDSGIDAADDDVKNLTPSRKRKRTTSRVQRTRPRTPQRAAARTTETPKSTPPKRQKTTPKSSAKKQRPHPSQSQSQSPTKAKKSPVKVDTPKGFIPNWLDGRIPYQSWVDIFRCASGDGAETGWLLHVATSCKTFFEPAMAALYRSPQPHTLAKARKLVVALDLPSEATLLNYRNKVKALHVNIDNFPLQSIHGLVRPLHRLRELIIFTPLDQPPYRNLDKTIRCNYTRDLFAALDPNTVDPSPEVSMAANSPAISLKSWEWSSRLLGGYVADMGDITRIHQLPSFATITRLSFTNFQIPSLHKTVRPNDQEGNERLYQEDARAIDSIADAILQLKSLKHLVFESSTIMNDRLLPQLPKGLVQLELINCWEITSDDLAAFLLTHGNELCALTLLHNQSLNLAFLTDLAETCPKLRELRVNLSYYRHHDTINDGDPMYEHALLPGQVPSWPTSLRVIEVEQVRQWTAETAEMFMQSLIDSAPALPDLRHLSVKYTLDIPWQERAKMRGVWPDRMKKIFLRVYTPPIQNTTLRPQMLVLLDSSPATKQKQRKKKDDETPSRRSGRIATHTSDSDRSATGRLRNTGRPTYCDPDTDEDEFSEDDVFNAESGDEGVKKKTRRSLHQSNDDDDTTDDVATPTAPPFIHGMCHSVNILFDNQKPREIQYGMEDFQDDDDDSSGLEWNSDDDVDDSVLAWR